MQHPIFRGLRRVADAADPAAPAAAAAAAADDTGIISEWTAGADGNFRAWRSVDAGASWQNATCNAAGEGEVRFADFRYEALG